MLRPDERETIRKALDKATHGGRHNPETCTEPIGECIWCDCRRLLDTLDMIDLAYGF
jgi:hypothetical protein